jgi:hypothetical protein
MTTNLTNKPSTTALLLGAGGLIPYIVLSSLSVFTVGTQQEYLVFSLLAYGATIISFLGAIHWGLTIIEASPTRLRLIWSVTPSLIAWLSLILNAPTGLYIQIIVLWICLLVDIPPRHNSCRLVRTKNPGGGDEGNQWHVTDNHSRTGQ